MPNITLPTEVERAAVDTSAFTWSDSDPGALTKAHGALLKLICDQLEAGEYVQVVSPGRGTGKTPKFIVQNTAFPLILLEDPIFRQLTLKSQELWILYIRMNTSRERGKIGR